MEPTNGSMLRPRLPHHGHQGWMGIGFPGYRLLKVLDRGAPVRRGLELGRPP